jgi:LacI family transcriptional regulator
MDELKYKPNIFARGLAGGQSMTIGIITQNIGSPFYDMLTQGIIQGLTGTDYSPLFVDGQWKPDLERAAIETLINRQVDGLIMVGGYLDGAELDQLRGDIPMVIIARRVPGWEDRSVAFDNVAGGKAATQLLIDSGHKNIAHIMGNREHADAVDRYNGYKQAMREANLEISDELFTEGDFSCQSGVLAMETLLLRKSPFSAVFVSNDEMAFGARLALYRRGIRVPEEVSIVGFDDQLASAYMTPPLTTIAQPANPMGIAGAEMLIALLDKREFEFSDLPIQVIIRESVTRAGRSGTA